MGPRLALILDKKKKKSQKEEKPVGQVKRNQAPSLAQVLDLPL